MMFRDHRQSFFHFHLQPATDFTHPSFSCLIPKFLPARQDDCLSAVKSCTPPTCAPLVTFHSLTFLNSYLEIPFPPSPDSPMYENLLHQY